MSTTVTTDECPTDSNPLNLYVIGAGLPRTGTKSLQKALEILYNLPCYHMLDIPMKRRCDIAKWQLIFDQLWDDKSKPIDEKIVHDIFGNYRLIADQCVIPVQLFNMCPTAKVIVPLRDSKKWAESLRETVRSEQARASHKSCLDKLAEAIVFGRNYSEMIDRFLRLIVGCNTNEDDDDEMAQQYDKYMNYMRNCIPANQILFFNLAEGWQPLCRFLDMPVPLDQPFPHVNDRQELLKFMRYGRIAVLAMKALSVGSAVCIGVGIMIFWMHS